MSLFKRKPRTVTLATEFGPEVVPERVAQVILDVLEERRYALAKHGEPTSRIDGTGQYGDGITAKLARVATDYSAAKTGDASWRLIAYEEVTEAFAETDPSLLYDELIDSAQVFVSWAAAIRRRNPEAFGS